MKKVYFLSTVLFCVVLASCTSYNNEEAANSQIKKVNKDKPKSTDAPDEFVKQDFEMTKDPRTKTVPRERLFNALEYYQRAQKVANESRSTKTSIFSDLTWTERGPTQVAGRTRAIIFDYNDPTRKRVFAGSVGGGLWKCNDITATNPVWVPVDDQFANLAVTSIAQDTSNPQIIYFGTGEGWFNSDAIKGGGIWKSTNGGISFSRLAATTTADFGFIQKLLITPSGLYVACRGVNSNEGGLRRSTNGGISFSLVLGSGFTDKYIADIEANSAGDLFATAGIFTTGRIFKSPAGVNNGNSGSWTNITPSIGFASERIEIAISPSNPDVGYALFQSASSNDCAAIYKSSNLTAATPSWSAATVPTIIDQGSNSNFTRGQAWYDLIAAVHPTNSDILFVGGVDICRSTNSGASWIQLTTWSLYNATPTFSVDQLVHADQHAMVFRPGHPDEMLIGCDGGVYYSADVVLPIIPVKPDWVSKNNGFNITQYYANATHPTNINYFLGGTQDNGTHKFTTSGLNSGIEVTGGDGAFCFIDQTNGNNQITSYVRNNFYKSTNGGISFTSVPSGSNNGRFINPADLDDANNILYSGGSSNLLVRWNNVFASSSRNDLSLSLGGGTISAIKVSPNVANTVYVGTGDGAVYKIENAHTATPTVSLKLSSALTGGYVSCIDVWDQVVGSSQDDSIVVAFSNYGVNSVYYTSNGAAAISQWINIDDNNTLQDIPIRWVTYYPENPTKFILASEVGILMNTNLSGATTSWQLVNNNELPMVSSHMVHINSANQLVVATHGRGIWTSNNVAVLPSFEMEWDAKLVNKNALISWSLSNEQNVGSYFIERMHSNEMVFSTVENVTANGQLTYTYTDPMINLKQAPIYYRIGIQSINGSKQYTEVIRIDGTKNENEFITNVFPTIFQNDLKVNTGHMDLQRFEIIMTDMMGRLVYRNSHPYQPTTLHLSHLPTGIYTLYCHGGKESKIIKVVKR